MKIAVAGLGYVGMANAVLLAQHNSVVAIDIDAERVDMVNNRHTTIVDPLIAEYLAHHNLDLRTTTDAGSVPGSRLRRHRYPDQL